MADRRLVNSWFEYLRTWLYPAQAGESGAPTMVDDKLKVTVDVERWVPVPQYVARVISPAVVGRYACVNFDLAVIGRGQPVRFNATNITIIVWTLGALNSRIFTRKGGGFQTLANLAAADETRTFMGDQRQATLSVGDAPVNLAKAPLILPYSNENYAVPMPDLEAGNAIQLMSTLANTELDAQIWWKERRPPGTPL